ncbi:hypothetical protein [Echinicola rosea]|uniref:hypothetical protein n=1 Tax=Echinicola rosea TaxID=1807691 RepID=UPI001C9DAA3F|nr:hypothetical protein [Echinicola rosea]
MDTNNNAVLSQVAEITLSYRPNSKMSDKPQIVSSQSAQGQLGRIKTGVYRRVQGGFAQQG